MKINRVNIILGLLALCVLLIGIGYYFIITFAATPGRHAYHPMMIFVIFTIAITICLVLMLTRNLLAAARKEQIVMMQEMHIEHLKEMVRVIKTQRHDFIDHLQTVYGLMKLGDVEQAQNHIANFCRDVEISGEALRIAVPEVTALLMVKAGIAASRNISFHIDVGCDLSGLKIRPLDIVAVLGNMLNNAIEAVEELEMADKQVELRIFEEPYYIIFQTRNKGFIPEDLQGRVFEPGFTTKTGTSNSGLGLAAIRDLVGKYKGSLSLTSSAEQGTILTVCLPE